MANLVPADRTRCQVEITEPHGFMVLGPRPTPYRCPNKPIVVLTEKDANPKDGQRGSMSACLSCLPHLASKMDPFSVLYDPADPEVESHVRNLTEVLLHEADTRWRGRGLSERSIGIKRSRVIQAYLMRHALTDPEVVLVLRSIAVRMDTDPSGEVRTHVAFDGLRLIGAANEREADSGPSGRRLDHA